MMTQRKFQLDNAVRYVSEVDCDISNTSKKTRQFERSLSQKTETFQSKWLLKRLRYMSELEDFRPFTILSFEKCRCNNRTKTRAQASQVQINIIDRIKPTIRTERKIYDSC